MTQKLKAVIFIGSNRPGRNADRVATFAKSLLESRNFEVKTLDSKELQLPLLERAVHHYQDASQIPHVLATANETIKEADAYVIVGGEYNRSMQPALKNMLDHFCATSYSHKPVTIISYSAGGTAGACANVSLLPVLRELGMLPTFVFSSISTVEKALSADGQVQSGFEYMKSSIELSIDQLRYIGCAMKKARDNERPPKVHPYLPN